MDRTRARSSALVLDKDGGTTEYTADITVDNAPPSIEDVSNDGPTVEGGSAEVAVAASDPAGANDPLAYEFDCGGDGAFEVVPSPSTRPCAPLPTHGTFDVNVRVTDGDGGEATAATTVQVANGDPTGTLAAESPVNEGSTFSVAFGDATDPSPVDAQAGLRFVFDCAGGSLDGAGYSDGATDPGTSCSFDDGPATRTIRARVIDKDGGFSEQSVEVAVDNVAPEAAFAAPTEATEQDSFALALTDASDPSGADLAAGLAYAFDCGDGSGFGEFSDSAEMACVAVGDGRLMVRGKVRDKDGGSSPYSAEIAINVLPPTIESVANDGPISEGGRATIMVAATNVGGPNDELRYAFDCDNDGAFEVGPRAANTAECRLRR